MIPLVSVIVPVYNSVRFLERCVTSVLAQRLDEIELILVDDGSTDGSGRLCDRLGADDARIHVIHQSNQGVSAARNAGLTAVKGEYIHFVDSDDYLADDFYRVLLSKMIDNNCGIGCANSFIQQQSGEFNSSGKGGRERVMTKEDAIEELLKCEIISYSLCDKLFQRDLLKNIKFTPNIHHNEDFLFCYEAFKYCKKVYFTPQAFYYYCNNEGSAVNSKFNDNKFTAVSAQMIVHNDIKINFKKLAACADTNFYKVLLYLASQIQRDSYNNKKNRRKLQELVRSEIFSILGSGLAIGYKRNALALAISWRLLGIINNKSII